MTYRIRTILVAIGLALAAMLLTLLYVTNVRRSAQHDAANVSVFVAGKDLPTGTSGAQLVKEHEIRLTTVPKHDVVPGAISSPAQVDSLLLAAPLYQGEQVTLRRFTTATAVGIRAQLSGAMRAVQIAGDPNQLLAGTLQAGDRVDVVANIHITDSTGNSNDKDLIVLHNLQVLSTNGADSKVAPSPGSTNSVILAVSDTQVQKLFYVEKNADWTLELRPVINATDGSEPTVGQSQVLGGS